MTNDQIAAFAILAGALILFAWGRFRHDIVALAALVAAVASGVAPAESAFSGFGHPAVITVATVLIISQGLQNSGAIDLVAQRISRFTEGEASHIGVLSAVGGAASAFMNNVGALALLLPVALTSAEARGRSPAILLMPLAFACILGGMATMIGTPPNIIIATYRGDALGEPFGMFDFTPVGLAVALVGVLFIALVGWRLIPAARREDNAAKSLFRLGDYVAELRVGAGSALANRSLADVRDMLGAEIRVIGMERQDGRAVSAHGYRLVREGDLLVVRADPAALEGLSGEHKLSPEPAHGALDEIDWEDVTVVEAVVAAGSPLIGRDTAYLGYRVGRDVELIAVARAGSAIRRRLREVRFAAGDILLLQGEGAALAENYAPLGLLPLAERGLRAPRPQMAATAVACFALAIAVAGLGLAPIGIAFAAVVLVYAVIGLLPARELYDGVDWPVIVLLGAMMPVGEALDATGATALVAGVIVHWSLGAPVWLLVAAVMVVTMFLSDIVNNAATALVMAPISLGVAEAVGGAPDAFLMAVAIGASCAFLTPIGHQCNTLVMGPGGYRFGDYWRMGAPLEALIVIIATPLIMVVFG